MALVLAMSSWVSAGHVGLSAMAPVLQSLGHEIIQLPTVVLSNHTGWPNVAGRAVPPDQLRDMLDAVASNGWLSNTESFLAGYMPSANHVEVACYAVGRLRKENPGVRITCDPVLGDDPDGLYLARDAAEAVRDRLVPVADTVTPNRFELAWLTGRSVATLDDAILAALALTKSRPSCAVLVTSPPITGGDTGILEVSGSETLLYRTHRRALAPKGVGDVFSALIAAGLPTGAALGHLDALIEASIGAEHLAIADGVGAWRDAPPVRYQKQRAPVEAR